MLGDTYSKYLPEKCPKCKCNWKWSSVYRLNEYPMIAVNLKDAIDITCSNPKCKANIVYKKVEKNAH